MIPLSAQIELKYIPISDIIISDLNTIDINRISFYVKLLEENKDKDTDPIIIKQYQDKYTIYNGHHRFLAHIAAGRTKIIAILVHAERW